VARVVCRIRGYIFRPVLFSPLAPGALAGETSDLWPAEEEETADGIYLRLKDGTGLVGEKFSWRKNRNVAG
jgi:hypothetical protein